MGPESKCPCPNSAPCYKVVWSQASDLTSLNFSCQFRNRIAIFPVWTAVKMKWHSRQRSLASYPALWKCSGNISWNIHLSYLKQRERYHVLERGLPQGQLCLHISVPPQRLSQLFPREAKTLYHNRVLTFLAIHILPTLLPKQALRSAVTLGIRKE